MYDIAGGGGDVQKTRNAVQQLLTSGAFPEHVAGEKLYLMGVRFKKEKVGSLHPPYTHTPPRPAPFCHMTIHSLPPHAPSRPTPFRLPVRRAAAGNLSPPPRHDPPPSRLASGERSCRTLAGGQSSSAVTRHTLSAG